MTEMQMISVHIVKDIDLYIRPLFSVKLHIFCGTHMTHRVHTTIGQHITVPSFMVAISSENERLKHKTHRGFYYWC